jgi:hypothetical protein
MKTPKSIILVIALLALCLPFLSTAKSDMKKHDMVKMMGKPTVDATVDGVQMKVWVITQKQHKKIMKKNMGHMMENDTKGMNHDGMNMNDSGMTMNKDMKGMKHEGMEMDKATKEAMMAGTHHIMLDVKDAVSGKEINVSTAMVMIMSPSKMNSNVDLKAMMSHFGNGLKLDEKGTYTLTVHIVVNGVSKMKDFQYTVK